MGNVNLFKDSYNGREMSFNTASIDMTDLQQNEITWIDNQYATYSATGDIVHLLRFNIELAGMNRIIGYVNDPTSSQNLCYRPSYKTIVGGTEENPTYTIDTLPNAEQVTIGQKPDDWDSKYPVWYYTKRTYPSGNTTYIIYDHVSTAWDSATQYYKDTTQQLYYTSSQGFFGVARFYGLLYNGLNNAFREGIYVCLPTFDRPYHPQSGTCCFKSGGLFGNLIFNSTNFFDNQSIPYYVNTTPITIDGTHTSMVKHLCQMCEFRYEVQDTSHDGQPYTDTFKGIMVIEVSADDIPQKAYVIAVQNAFWFDNRPPRKGETSHKQGGNGTFQAPSDNRGDRNGGTAGAISSRWGTASSMVAAGYNNYYVNSATINAFKEMVTNLWDPDMWQGFANMMYNPISSIMCCHQLPAKLVNSALTGGSTDVIKAAGVNLSTTQTNTFGTWNAFYHIVKSFDIEEYSGDFSDYSSTAVFIHLPYVGTKQIDTLAVMGGWISVDYLTDLFTGDCTAFVTVADRNGNTEIRYEWKGHCGKDVPLTQKVPVSTQVMGAVGSGLLTMGLTAAGGALAGKIGGAIAGLGGAIPIGNTGGTIHQGQLATGKIGQSTGTMMLTQATSMATSATNALLSGQNTTTSNASGGGVSSPSDTMCYLIIARPQESDPQYYGEQKGYPCDISGTISGEQLNGFFSTQTIDVSSITDATDEEKFEIQQRLSAGVYVSNISY